MKIIIKFSENLFENLKLYKINYSYYIIYLDESNHILLKVINANRAETIFY
jgi:hypothetical protein